MTVDKYILESSKLRGQGNFEKAIELIETKRESCSNAEINGS